MEEESGLTHSTIEAMKHMAAEPLKAEAIVKDETCLGGLVMVLANKDKTIVKTALETLELLTKLTQYRHHMKQSLGMMAQLNTVANLDCPQISELAMKIYETLAQSSSSQAPVDHSHLSHALRDTANQTRTNNTPHGAVPKSKRRNSFFVGGVAKCKTVVLQIKGMDHRDDVELCRNSILTVSGIVSITFDYKHRRAVIRCKPDLKAELLGQAVAKTMTMSAHLVTKDDFGNEVLVALTSQHTTNKENEDLMPDYPSSDDDKSPLRCNNMARMGASRDRDGAGGWGFVKSVGSFLSNSFYW